MIIKAFVLIYSAKSSERVMALLIIQQKPQEKMCVIETLYLLFLDPKQLPSKRHILIKIIFFLINIFYLCVIISLKASLLFLN